MNKIIKNIAEELGIKEEQVNNTVKLIDEGNTIPFIARYRKEATGGLSDEILRDLDERLKYLRNLGQLLAVLLRTVGISLHALYHLILTRLLRWFCLSLRLLLNRIMFGL